MNLTDIFVDRMFEISITKMPENIICQVKQCVLDYLACTFAGSKLNIDMTKKLIEQFDEDDSCTVFGTDIKCSLFASVLANGFNSHIAELDDGNRFGMMHVGAPVLSALLPFCQKNNVDKNKFVNATVAGYEAAVLCSRVMQPYHKVRGYHTTGTCGTIGAAIAVAVASGYDKAKLKSTISCAVSSVAGVLELQENNSQLKPYNVARASLDGLVSAITGKCGYISPDDALGGKRGLFKVYSDDFNSGVLTEKSSRYEIENVYFKKYSACRHCHSPIEVVLNIKDKYNLDCDCIKSIEIFTYKLAISGHDHIDISSESSAKMSIPFSVAVALVTGSAGIDKYTLNYIHDEKIALLCKKTRVLEDKELTSLCPGIRAARAKIITNDNQVYEELVKYSKGEPENPISYEEIKEKFFELCEYSGLSEKNTHRIIKMIEEV